MFGSRICIGGLPGIGSVGKIAADYLSTALECRSIQSILSKGFPPQVTVTSGQVSLLQAELKMPIMRRDLLILSGDAQPLGVMEMYSLAGDILEAARSLQITDFITLAAYVGDSKAKVVGAASGPDLARRLEDSGVPLMRSGAIGGLNGLLAGLSPLYGINGYCLLGTTSGDHPVDLQAAQNLLGVVVRLLGLEIPLDALEIQVSGERPDMDMYYR
jgi:proteasome assembly chaperone (PAC2) family protein